MIDQSNAADVAFRKIMNEHLVYVRGQIAYCGIRGADVDDLVQEVFLHVYRKLDQFEEGTNFRAWARAIIRNKCMVFIRTMQRRQKLTDAFQEELSLQAESHLKQHEDDMFPKLENCLGKLSEDDRKLLRLRYSGTSIRELSDNLKQNEPAFKTRLSAETKTQRLHGA